jgi:predicted TIM-barrel fold metal-dependent hydrolase
MATPALPPLLSSDGHLEVLPERWTSRIPARLRAKAPRTIRLPDGGDALQIEDQEPRPVPFLDLRAGRTNENWQPFGTRVEGTAGVGPPEQRLQEQDVDGLLAEVLFPNMQMGPRLWRSMTDDEAYGAAVRAYNDWLGEEYCAVSRDRLVGLGVIPWTNVDDAVAELAHCAKIGLRGVILGVFPSGKSYPTLADDRFWAAAVDMNMPLTVHVGFDRLGPRDAEPTFEYRDADPAMVKKIPGRTIVEWMALLGLPPALSLTQMLMSGAFDRVPELRVFFAETRLGWVPFWMEEADYWYERHRHWAERLLNLKPLRQRPSDYVRQHVYFSVQHVERVAVELRHHLGVEHVMFATDFPHIECDWPNTRPFAERLFADVPADEAFKIAAGNMLAFFHLGDTPVGRKALAARP